MIDIHNDLYAYPIKDSVSEIMSDKVEIVYDDSSFYYISQRGKGHDNLAIISKRTGERFRSSVCILLGLYADQVTEVKPPYNLKIGRTA